MHTDTGIIERIKEQEMKELMNDPYDNIRRHSLEHKMVELTEDETKDCETMPLYQRKGYMRNKPCVCGSGKKFKKCCWSKYS